MNPAHDWDELTTPDVQRFAIQLPTTPGQYLLAPDNGDWELWRLTAHGWFDASGVYYSSPLERNSKLTRWQGVEQYPTLHAIGLGPQLDEVERICAEAQRGKHKGESIFDLGASYHFDKSTSHLSETYVRPKDGPIRLVLHQRDADSGARHLIHAAARLLFAAACLDGET